LQSAMTAIADKIHRHDTIVSAIGQERPYSEVTDSGRAIGPTIVDQM